MKTILTIYALNIKHAVISPAIAVSKFNTDYKKGLFTIPPKLSLTYIPPKAPKLATPITGTINI